MDELQSYSTVEQRLMLRSAAAGIPVSGTLELLPLCNMNCDMCYVRLSKQEAARQGRIRSGSEWLKLGKEMADAGVLFLQLTGGEVLLHPDFKEIYLGLRKMGMVLTVNTNATLLDEEWADFFAANKPRRLGITLYGADADAYERLCHHRQGFDRTMNALRMLKARGVDVRLGVSVSSVNAGEVARIRMLAQELDMPLNVDTYMLPATRERTKPFNQQSRLCPEDAAALRVQALKWEYGENFPLYLRHKLNQIDAFVPGESVSRFSSCLAGRCSFCVNWLGLLQPCVILSEPAVNVFDSGFRNAWAQMSAGVGEIRLNPECSSCRLNPLCNSCAASARSETGDFSGKPEYLCRYAAETERLLRLEMQA